MERLVRHTGELLQLYILNIFELTSIWKHTFRPYKLFYIPFSLFFSIIGIDNSCECSAKCLNRKFRLYSKVPGLNA